MLELIRDLCAFRTGVVADENKKLFERIERELPLEYFEFPSGETYNGWLVPMNWRVKSAKLYKDDKEVFDGTQNSLGVAYYSKSFSGEISWDDLKPKIVTNPELPEAYMFHCMWQYRPWDADWRFVIPYNIYRTLGEGNYRVHLETEYTNDKMLVTHSHKQGRSSKTIVFNSNTCHPHMANDGFAGTTVLIRLMQWLSTKDTFYSYRLVMGPEHLGSVFYLNNLPKEEVDEMVSGVFEEMPGTQGPMKATSTFLGGQMIDDAFANVLSHSGSSYSLVPWRQGAGNDETVWEAPGYEIPFVELTRCEDMWAPYREYHSHLDSPEIIDSKRLEEMLNALKGVVDVLEQNCLIQKRHFDGLICLSNPMYDLYMERPDPTVTKDLEEDAEKWGKLVDSLFRYFDGNMTVLDIAMKHDLPFWRVKKYLQRYEDKGLITLVRAEISRNVPHRVDS